jgi:hypothetical protein
MIPATTVANKPGTPGRVRISRKPIAQGRPVVRADTCGSAACFFSARGPWVRPAPGLPRTLSLSRVDDRQSSDANAPRERSFLTLSLGRADWTILPTAVMPAEADIQYAAGLSVNQGRLWDTGSSACAVDDAANSARRRGHDQRGANLSTAPGMTMTRSLPI